MWLINTQTYKLEAIINPEPKSYAILSHTWGDGEISFAQYRKFYRAAKKNGLAWVLRRVRKRDGLHKILKTVEMARSRGLQYAWVDTCCIDKSSSDELSEAINSMFKWYANASVCFAYLSDLPTKEQIRKELSVPASDADSDAANPDWHRDLDSPINKRWCQYFRRCRWFTRGWTLQELIAPRVLEFYDCQWNTAGSKLALRELIHDITHITLRVLEDGTRLSSTPVAVRMSWAADRDTTRAEDMAYCLVGIFDLNMPFLYGEGDKAFIRLQEEICKQSADLTLFAWVSQARYPQSPREQYRGMFAKHVSEFKYCNSIYHVLPGSGSGSEPYSGEFRVTNRGLCLEECRLACLGDCFVLYLDCMDMSNPTSAPLGVAIMRTPWGYVRARPDWLYPLSYDDKLYGENMISWKQMARIYVHKTLPRSDFVKLIAFSVTLKTSQLDIYETSTPDRCYFDPLQNILLPPSASTEFSLLCKPLWTTERSADGVYIYCRNRDPEDPERYVYGSLTCLIKHVTVLQMTKEGHNKILDCLNEKAVEIYRNVFLSGTRKGAETCGAHRDWYLDWDWDSFGIGSEREPNKVINGVHVDWRPKAERSAAVFSIAYSL